jgi:SAM-dependent methyltransferase
MRFTAFTDIFIGVYRENGLRGVASHLAWWLGRGRKEFLQSRSNLDNAFDAQYGTKSGGVEALYNFQIVGENARHGLTHIASNPWTFPEVMNGLGIDHTAFTFIDLGSGKGRALMLAAAYPFRRIIGVEFAAELHAIAEENIAAFNRNRSSMAQIQLVHADAAEYQLPEEPLIIYLFNPFRSVVVRRVAEMAMASWRASPRPIHVVYVGPVYLSDFIDSGWQLVDRTDTCAYLVPNRTSAARQDALPDNVVS